MECDPCPNTVPLHPNCTSVPNDPNPLPLLEKSVTYNTWKDSIVIMQLSMANKGPSWRRASAPAAVKMGRYKVRAFNLRLSVPPMKLRTSTDVEIAGLKK